MSRYPDRKYMQDVFLLLLDPREGTKKFFEYVHHDVKVEVTGLHRFSGVWYSKSEYFEAAWNQITSLLAEPGLKLEMPGGDGAMIADSSTGWCAVEFRTVDVTTQSGIPYNQHYTWHCQWNGEGKMVVIKVFLDSDHLEKILGKEQEKREMV